MTKRRKPGRGEQRERGRTRRERRRYLLIAAEGRNKTERLYIESLIKNQKVYAVHFTAGSETDAPQLVQSAIHARERMPDWSEGDAVFVLSDMDTEEYKKAKAEEAIRIADKSEIELLLSTPCFEIWYLLHFRYSTRQYSSSAEAVDELRKYVKDYQKNSDIAEMLKPLQAEAIARAKKAEKYHETAGRKRWERNSGTEVYHLVELLKMAEE